MFEPKIEPMVRALAKRELEYANSVYPLFASDHEACAVMREEYEEAQEQLERCENYLVRAWKMIRCDEDISEPCRIIEAEAELLACEAIQLAAMARKARMSIEERQGKEGEKNE